MDPGLRDIQVMMTSEGCNPLDLRMPAGEEITLRLDNQTGKVYSWIFMNRPTTQPFDAQDAQNVYFAHQVQPGQTETVHFITPKAAMEYDVICSPLPHSDDDEVGRIVVVRVFQTP